MIATATRCVLLSCSRTKRRSASPLPAIERYDGPLFRTTRRYLNFRPIESNSLIILILSAKYGLIKSSQRIPYYDTLMTPNRASSLRSQVMNGIKIQYSIGQFAEMFVSVDADYEPALPDFETALSRNVEIIRANGGPGTKSAQLKRWLYGAEATSQRLSCVASWATGTPRGNGVIRGRLIKLTPNEVIDCARKALRQRSTQAENYRDWFVQIDQTRVGPKWLVSQLTGLSVSDFTSGEARRVLSVLGISVFPARDL